LANIGCNKKLSIIGNQSELSGYIQLSYLIYFCIFDVGAAACLDLRPNIRYVYVMLN